MKTSLEKLHIATGMLKLVILSAYNPFTLKEDEVRCGYKFGLGEDKHIDNLYKY